MPVEARPTNLAARLNCFFGPPLCVAFGTLATVEIASRTGAEFPAPWLFSTLILLSFFSSTAGFPAPELVGVAYRTRLFQSLAIHANSSAHFVEGALRSLLLAGNFPASMDFPTFALALLLPFLRRRALQRLDDARPALGHHPRQPTHHAPRLGRRGPVFVTPYVTPSGRWY